MKLITKILKMHEVGERIAVHVPTVDEYLDLMENTFPEPILRLMWEMNGDDTCIAVIDETESLDPQPLARQLISADVARDNTLTVVNTAFVLNYAPEKLPVFDRGSRVKINGFFMDRDFRDTPAIVYGFKATKRADGAICQMVRVAGSKLEFVIPENMLSLDASHPANEDIEKHLRKEEGRVRAPAGQKKPV